MQEQQKAQPSLPQSLSPETPEKERPAIKETGVQFVIHGFRFSGNEGLATDAELNGLLKDAIGKEMGIVTLKRFADRVTKYLNNKGLFLARAYIPEQEMRDGVAEIAILSGKIEGGAEVRGENLRIGQSTIQKIAGSVVPEGQAATQQDLERAVLLVNDLPGVKATSTLEPGATTGTAKMRLDVTEGFPVAGMVWGDNSGSRYTGQYRGSALIQVNDPLGCGDQMTFTSTDNTNYRYVQGGYSLPVGWSGLRAGISYSEMRYNIDNSQINLGLNGGSRTAAATLAYPIVRSRTANLWAGVEYDWKNLWDRESLIYTDNKFINAGGAHVNGDFLDTFLGGGYSTLNLGITSGSLDLSAVPSNEALAKDGGQYGKVTYGGNRLQKLYENLSFFLSVTGQVGFDNLDSSEKFLLGGPNGVRAYPTGEAPGDSGMIATAEVRYDFPQVWILGVPQLVGFYDLGWTESHINPWPYSGTAFGNRNEYCLSGAGVGVNLNKSGVYAIHLAWAARIGDNPGRSAAGLDSDGKKDSNRFWLQAMIMF